jgi:hypothetical protein
MSPTTTAVNVSVTPKVKQGDKVYCEIDRGPHTSSQHVKGGIIKLPRSGETYEVNFAIDTTAAEGGAEGLSWAEGQMECQTPASSFKGSNAFWSNQGSCPSGPMQDSQVKSVDVAGTVLTVTIVPDGNKNVVHYSLNFADGSSCDPIIINT